LSIYNDKRVVLWNTSTWEPVSRFYSGPGTTKLWFSPDGSTLIGTGVNKEIRLWDIHTGIERIITAADSNGLVRFTSTKTICVVFCHDGSLDFYDLHTQQHLKHASPPASFSSIFQHCGWIDRSARLVAIEGQDHSIQLWSIDQETTIMRFIGHESDIRDIAFHPNNSWIASASEEGIVKLWEMHSGTTINTFYSSAPDIWEIEFNPTFSLLAVINGQDYIEIWETTSGVLRTKLTGHDSQITAVFSPDGKELVSGSDDFKIRVWAL
jgi:WD40 repeat protein